MSYIVLCGFPVIHPGHELVGTHQDQAGFVARTLLFTRVFDQGQRHLQGARLIEASLDGGGVRIQGQQRPARAQAVVDVVACRERSRCEVMTRPGPEAVTAFGTAAAGARVVGRDDG